MQKREYSTIKELIEKNLNIEEDLITQELINELKPVKERGYFTKDEFMKMGMWKSPRPKQQYLKNSEEDIIRISKAVLSTNSERLKINLLTRQLRGVSIPTASAILALIDPQNYGVIDIRVWQLLYLYRSVRKNPAGIGMDFADWYYYLMKLRYYANIFKVKARDIERTLFLYHKRIQEGNLYKKYGKQN
jgi:thermostable 8-oxoguanine DNA glycosylase